MKDSLIPPSSHRYSFFAALLALVVMAHPCQASKETEKGWERKLLAAMAKRLPVGADIRIDRAWTPSPVPDSATVELTGQGLPIGVVPFVAEWQDGFGPQNVQGTAQVRVWANVAVTRRAMWSGEPVSAKDVSWSRREVRRATLQQPYLNPSEIEGLRVKTHLAAGTVLNPVNTEPKPLINAGDNIYIEKRTTHFTLSVQGRALENGLRGQRIRVLNPRTRRTIVGVVLDPERVQIGG